MQPAAKRYMLNETECASKVIDGEAVIINLSNGTYYSLEKVGARVWEWLGEGCTVGAINERVVAQYDVEHDRANADIAALVGALVLEKLLVPVGEDALVTDGEPADSGGIREEYVTPALLTYRDMADLLALDPPLPRLEDVVWNEPELSTAQQTGTAN